MQIAFTARGQLTALSFSGPLDGEIDREAELELRAGFRPGARFVLDMSGVSGVTATGLRWLRLLDRQIHGQGGRVRISGLTREWIDVLDAVGLLQLSVPLPDEEFDGVDPLRPLAEQRLDLVPTHRSGEFLLRQGHVYPFGAWPVEGGVNFSIGSRTATGCTLVLYDRGRTTPRAEIPFPPEFRIGHVFCMLVLGLEPAGLEYGYRMAGRFAPEAGLRFDESRILLDPYARGITGQDVWARPRQPAEPFALRGFIPATDFEWEGDRPLERPMQDLVIYELHVRGFTRHASSGVRSPGTYAAIREKIPYLVELGINAVELMPIFEFDEWEHSRIPAPGAEPLLNYWGYSTLGFWAPKAGFAATGGLGLQVDELKALVKDLHRNGIEVILDVVFNHSAEGNERGPTLSFRGIDNATWYMLTPDGGYYNFSGCGNTLNCNDPTVRDFILTCLRYWVAEFHIDGFRFDLASILGRNPWGVPLANPPLLESLALDPVLGRTKLIAEAWDAGGLYQVGTFPDYGRWAEWNGRFRDCTRRFLKGDPGQAAEFARRLVGSPDLYSDTGPTASVNFITCHDGFTLADLVSYDRKHNDANGEQNRDGCNDNASWNCGVEGPTSDPAVLALRSRQQRNALTMLMLSQGVPMLLMGDEMGRTQAGNNNTYCHDSPLNWLDWTLADRHPDLRRFCRLLIRLRVSHPALQFPVHPERQAPDGSRLYATWHGTRPFAADWSAESRIVALELNRVGGSILPDVLYAAFNMHWEPHAFGLPALPEPQRWHVAVNTGMASPEDIWEVGSEPALADQAMFFLAARSVAVLVAKPGINEEPTPG